MTTALVLHVAQMLLAGLLLAALITRWRAVYDPIILAMAVLCGSAGVCELYAGSRWTGGCSLVTALALVLICVLSVRAERRSRP